MRQRTLPDQGPAKTAPDNSGLRVQFGKNCPRWNWFGMPTAPRLRVQFGKNCPRWNWFGMPTANQFHQSLQHRQYTAWLKDCMEKNCKLSELFVDLVALPGWRAHTKILSTARWSNKTNNILLDILVLQTAAADSLLPASWCILMIWKVLGFAHALTACATIFTRRKLGRPTFWAQCSSWSLISPW